MKIALFGGAFDPPHAGHQQVTAALLLHQLFDEVWYVPVGEHAFPGFKPKEMVSAEHRLAMLKLICDQPAIRVEEYELTKSGPSYTYDTLQYLTAQYPEHEFGWIIGSDNLAGFHKWLDVHALLLNHHFYVYPRAGYPMEPLFPQMTALTQLPSIEVSSTEVRAALSTGSSIQDLVDPRVAQYIETHHLYR